LSGFIRSECYLPASSRNGENCASTGRPDEECDDQLRRAFGRDQRLCPVSTLRPEHPSFGIGLVVHVSDIRPPFDRTHAVNAPATAIAATSQRMGPADTSSTGTRSGIHGAYGSAHSHRIDNGATNRARADQRLLECGLAKRAAAVAAAAPPNKSHNLTSGASSATRPGPASVHVTISIEAGHSQTATAVPTNENAMTPASHNPRRVVGWAAITGLYACVTPVFAEPPCSARNMGRAATLPKVVRAGRAAARAAPGRIPAET
jgi:hypothetical protein